MSAEVRPAGLEELPLLHAIRREVFVVGQGVPAEIEVDGRDADCAHVLALVDGAPVGTARLRVVDGHGKAERVAVLASHRGLGLGVALMAALEALARDAGHDQLHLHAQWPVVPFYERLGYVGRGDPFDEAGIRHLAMGRHLR